MIDHVLVTVQSPSAERDMELPSKMLVGELAKSLIEVFREIDMRHFKGKDTGNILFEGKTLPKDKTLEECYVWDGCILKIR